MTAILLIASLLAAMIIGVPVAYALLVASTVAMWYMDMFDVQIIAQNMINGADNYVLMAVPFFLLAGELMNAGGLSRRIVDLALVVVGGIRGGLGYVAIMAAIILASLSGSAVADTAALAAILLPMMRQAGYPEARSAGLIAAGGIIAAIIPPSIGLVVFGVAAGVSITKLFMGGIMPGLLMGATLAVAWFFFRPPHSKKVQGEATDGKALGPVLRRAAFSLMLPIIIIGGLRGGVFTPTEAAVIAVAYSLLVGAVIHRELSWAGFLGACAASAKLSAAILFLIGGAFVVSWLVTVADIPSQLVSLLGPVVDSPTILLLGMLLVVFLVGMFLDFTPTILILTPILMPLCHTAGIDPVYFGVLFMMTTALGLITPPVGTVLNATAGVARIPLERVIVGVAPFAAIYLLLILLLVLFPSIVLVPLQWLT